MPLKVDEDLAEQKSRLVMVSLVALTLRLMERWRLSIKEDLNIEPDYDTMMILGAIIAITSEKLMRASLPHSLESLGSDFPPELLTPCNVSSVAAATALNRETTRRKIKQLQDAAIVIRKGRNLYIDPAMLQLPALRETVVTQLKSIGRTINELARVGALQAPDQSN